MIRRILLTGAATVILLMAATGILAATQAPDPALRELLRDAVDIVLAHLGNLIETMDTQTFQGFFNGRPDALYFLQVIGLRRIIAVACSP